MKKRYRLLLIFLLIILPAFAGGVAFWSARTYRPSEIALQALESDQRVTVKNENGFITFRPADGEPGDHQTGFILYPGAGVDYRAYAPVLRKIAEQGYFVTLVQVPLNLAFFEINAADDVISEHPEVARWAVGGHSLGGAAASSYASNHPDKVTGLVFWASYPADDSLTNATIEVLSIYGTKDMGGLQPFESSRARLPADTRFVVMEGGNHAQFGSYGPQAGDNPADISAEEQWAQIVEATTTFLEALKEE